MLKADYKRFSKRLLGSEFVNHQVYQRIYPNTLNMKCIDTLHYVNLWFLFKLFLPYTNHLTKEIYLLEVTKLTHIDYDNSK